MKQFLRICAVLLCAASLFALTSCDSLVKITYEDGKYIDKTNGVTYIGASVSYEPVKIGSEYAKYGKTILYEISGLDPAQWLTESYEGIGSIYYADTVTLPSLQEFGAVKIYVCIEAAITMQVSTIDDEAAVSATVEALNAESVDLPQDGINNYHLKFVSDTYPSLYYDILYIEVDDQHNYLYDRATKQCVDVGRLLKDFLPSDSDMEAAALETSDSETQL